MRFSTIALVGLLGALLLERASGQAPVQPELRQDATRYNLGSTNGLPISSTRGAPAGSDGRAPTPEQQLAAGLTDVPATTNQFQALTYFGGGTKWGTNFTPNVGLSYIANVVGPNSSLPRGSNNNQLTLAMPRGRIGAPFIGRNLTVLFGQIIPAPETDEQGVPLSRANLAVNPPRGIQAPDAYWVGEPYTTSNHVNADYYYSPNAKAVFAVNPGRTLVAWRRNAPSTNNVTRKGVTTVSTLGSSYVVMTNEYVVSGSPVKKPRTMYWTERTFVDTGKPIEVPAARVGGVRLVYNRNFPERVPSEVVIPGVVPIVTSNALEEVRTIWFDEGSIGQIRAYNREGRVFMELLGDLRGDNSREHVGFEIVDVLQQPFPNDVTVELGERLTAFPGGQPGDEDLFPEPRMLLGSKFAYQHSPGGGSKPTYYAVRETVNQNDFQVHWMEEGLQGLRWPSRYVRYRLIWPEDVAKYSHYVRPLVATESEAKATAVALPSDNAPFIEYQDPLDQPRGKFTENFAYYTFLDRAHPAHRALLRFMSGASIRFERVFSWLDDGLKNLRFGFGSDFTRAPAGTTTFGDATVGDGQLHLTDATGTQTNSYWIDEFGDGQLVTSFRATFNVSLRGNPLSGGFSFNFGDVPSGGGVTTNGLSVVFRLSYDVNGEGVPGIEIQRDGTLVPNGFAGRSLATGTNWSRVEIVLREGGAMDVSYGGSPVLSNVPTGYTPRTGRFGFAGRTDISRPSGARQLNAWQIAASSAAAPNFSYSKGLVDENTATNRGWRYTVVSRLVAPSSSVSGEVGEMKFQDSSRRFIIIWSADASGRLTASLPGGVITNLTAAGPATNDYHTHELVYSPTTRTATYLFDGAPISSWAGIGPSGAANGVSWGKANTPIGGRMNYHRVRLDINTLGTVAEYFAGVDGEPAIAPDPASQGWVAFPLANAALNASPVSPDVLNNPGVDAYRLSVLAEPSLVGYYPADGDIAPVLSDRRIPAQNGTMTNTLIVAPKGAVGTGALQGGRVDLGLVPEYQFTNGTGTVEAYLYLRSSSRTFPSFFSCGTGGLNQRYSLQAFGNGNGIRLNAANDSGTQFNAFGWTTPTNLIDRWSHIAFVFFRNANGQNIRVYIDGTDRGTAVIPTGFLTNNVSLPCQIGASDPNVFGEWPGEIDELAIYTNALSFATIQAHAALLNPPPNTLVPAPVDQLLDDVSIVVNEQGPPAGPIAFATSVATNLNSWGFNGAFRWPDASVRPRVVDGDAFVGARISAPTGEIGAGLDTNYLGGYILQSAGTSFDVTAYADPFSAGRDAADRGAIIPVNVRPGADRLEVWWFRRNGLDAARIAQGFRPTLWPEVIGRYTLQWPVDPAEIVLASNDGSGALESLQANGRIYYQNDASLPGYNPNEEHALMQGGQAYALRDDLNITNASGFTSRPFVLLSYTEADGRPAMRPFRVLREKPEDGVTFDFVRTAGTVLQPPMPLPLLEEPFAPRVPGRPLHSLNWEIDAYAVASSAPQTVLGFNGQRLATTTRHFVRRFEPLALQNADAPAAPGWLFPLTVDTSTSNLVGWVSQIRPLTLQPWGGQQSAVQTRWRFAAAIPPGLVAGPALSAVYIPATASSAESSLQATVAEVNISSQYVELDFNRTVPFAVRDATNLTLTLPIGYAANALQNYRLATEPLPTTIADAAQREFYAKFTFQDRKGSTWVYRGPHTVRETPSFVMQYYYKTLAGFYFPTRPYLSQPPVGTITPYLRPMNADGSFVGHPVYGNIDENPQAGDGNALGIRYQPAWPDSAPVLNMAETLTNPRRSLPDVRSQTSLGVLYQQSHIEGGDDYESVVLHDPTREKALALAPTKLNSLPALVETKSYQGLAYFPKLPPHLVDRFFFDPNRGELGSLVFKGQYVEPGLGDSYLHLNVLSSSDAAELRKLCAGGDQKGAWDSAIAELSTTLETFIENPASPGAFIPNPDPRTRRRIGPGEIASVTDPDTAVDSYALTATGPGTGYVTLIAGNGRAATPEEDPVSVKIIQVARSLYRGEVNIVESSNPLSEKLTLQQIVDLAGKTRDYRFEWRIASSVDGTHPPVYQNQPRVLFPDANSGNSGWSHLQFPTPADTAASAPASAPQRIFTETQAGIVPVSRIPFESVQQFPAGFVFTAPHHGLTKGNAVVIQRTDGAEVTGTVTVGTTLNALHVLLDPNQIVTVSADDIGLLRERVVPGAVQSIVFHKFVEPAANYSQYWLSLDLDDSLGARVYVDGQLVLRVNTGEGQSVPSTPPPGIFPLSRAFALSPGEFTGGSLRPDGWREHTLAVELISRAWAESALLFDVQIDAFAATDLAAEDPEWVKLEGDAGEIPQLRAVVGGTPDVRSLSDNWLIMRYQPKNSAHASYVPDAQGSNTVWSQWTTPQLAEGWIKRVLKGINPFNQRITDLFNNSVNTDVSIVAQAGQRWEGDVALNLEAVNDAGLIEIYETVLRRGKDLSIGSGINYGPANDALLLAAGYLNDLYMVLGNEAWADAANPTIGFGTKDNTYGSLATALFSFKGQLPSVLEEELALMRGRDDRLLPGVEVQPVYNRLVWNYTRGIDAGEVVYALNYNVLDQNTDGKVDAEDARRLYPQGHGDAYGHYLTALKGYYALLMNTDFDWVPRIEAVTVLGKPVAVDYLDERKFAAAAAAVARAGKHVFDLTWRRDYKAGTGRGWAHFAQATPSTSRQVPVTGYWGMDHWAARTAQGAYLSWVVGNSILPDRDSNPAHQGSIQQVDRTTVPELKELAILEDGLQTALDNAGAGLTPLGLPEDTIPFDLNPLAVANGPFTHFEQIYTRAKDALNNAVTSFDDAKDVTRLMRSEEDSVVEFRAEVARQELAYTNALIELYGTPYPDDVGPGRTYRTGYNGPDTLHYMYVDTKELTFTGPQGTLLDPGADTTWRIDTQTFVPGWADDDLLSTFGWINPARIGAVDGQANPLSQYVDNKNFYIEYNLSSHGFFKKPNTWTGQRASPGRIQQAISDIVKARNAAYEAFYGADAAKYDLDWAIRSLHETMESRAAIRHWQEGILQKELILEATRNITDVINRGAAILKDTIVGGAEIIYDEIPDEITVGVADGGDIFSVAKAVVKEFGFIGGLAMDEVVNITETIQSTAELIIGQENRLKEFYQIAPEEFNQELRGAVSEVRDKVYGMNNRFMAINARLQELDDAQRAYRSAVAEGNRIQMERQVFRQRTAAVIQGYRTRDAAFRIFRNEKLERYKALFDLAAKYTFMAAQAYDYDTGLLHTDQGREFINRIVRSRALGVVQSGAPQFAGSNTGDPGLSSVLAEMYGDWSVVKSRLGFNNPDAYGTTVSLRTENLRILPSAYTYSNNIAVHDADWKDMLNSEAVRKDNLLDDPDVRRYCMQIDPGNGLPVPGLILEFSTTIADGLNLFGKPLAAWDHTFSPGSFATKIFAVGVALEGYKGMDDPDTNDDAVAGGGGASPQDPNLAFLDPDAMAATPYIYLIPVGVDSMRSPPLGDQSVIRTWNVQDVTIPLPFNIGGSDFSSKQLWQSDDSLTEPLFNIRKHQAFRPVSTATVFAENSIYSVGGELWHNKYTNTRLIGRSVWNSKWKLVIPGRTLLNDPKEGLERFIRTVHDIKLYFHTYSYSGN